MKPVNKPIMSAIVAMDENRAIGKNNRLPWHLPADLKHFKAITTGHPILMGRKTYESIGKPLPNRTNIIITRDPLFKAEGCVVVTSIDQAVARAGEGASDEIFIIGGAEIYRQAMPRVDRIYLTLVHQVVQADVFFPALDEKIWVEVSRERHAADEKNSVGYSFLVLERRIF